MRPEAIELLLATFAKSGNPSQVEAFLRLQMDHLRRSRGEADRSLRPRLELDPGVRRLAEDRLRQAIARAEAMNGFLITPWDESYPRRLRAITGPPPAFPSWNDRWLWWGAGLRPAGEWRRQSKLPVTFPGGNGPSSAGSRWGSTGGSTRKRYGAAEGPWRFFPGRWTRFLPLSTAIWPGRSWNQEACWYPNFRSGPGQTPLPGSAGIGSSPESVWQPSWWNQSWRAERCTRRGSLSHRADLYMHRYHGTVPVSRAGGR